MRKHTWRDNGKVGQNKDEPKTVLLAAYSDHVGDEFQVRAGMEYFFQGVPRKLEKALLYPNQLRKNSENFIRELLVYYLFLSTNRIRAYRWERSSWSDRGKPCKKTRMDRGPHFQSPLFSWNPSIPPRRVNIRVPASPIQQVQQVVILVMEKDLQVFWIKILSIKILVTPNMLKSGSGAIIIRLPFSPKLKFPSAEINSQVRRSGQIHVHQLMIRAKTENHVLVLPTKIFSRPERPMLQTWRKIHVLFQMFLY